MTHGRRLHEIPSAEGGEGAPSEQERVALVLFGFLAERATAPGGRGVRGTASGRELQPQVEAMSAGTHPSPRRRSDGTAMRRTCSGAASDASRQGSSASEHCVSSKVRVQIAMEGKEAVRIKSEGYTRRGHGGGSDACIIGSLVARQNECGTLVLPFFVPDELRARATLCLLRLSKVDCAPPPGYPARCART